ncbi:hypothetical protein LguiB_003781 [Lonicera macranthoides]
MDSKEYIKRLLNKRPIESCVDNNRPNKRPTASVNVDDDGPEKIYRFRVLLPNGTSLGLRLREPDNEMAVEMLIAMVKEEYFRQKRQTESPTQKRRINWKSADLCFLDAFDNKIRNRINFKNFQTNKLHILRLHDGSRAEETYENMWDLTPDTDLLKELPEEYTFETALADLIDNSLQAVWSVKGRRLVSVEIDEERISIFDTGPGMDGSEENSIAKWGKMGASMHRSSRGQAIGGSPPYLMPFFGMFGYGGPIASMHLGRRALVSSKTKESKKVYTLYLERDALLSGTGSKKTWRTSGGLRDPLEDETEKSPLGSFTKCDELSNKGRTTMPIEFQVNGVDLAEINSGEVAITNLHSCNGPEFILQLHFKQETTANSQGLRTLQANARLKCVYFPIIEGKESIERILEKLELEGCGITETYESFSRVSIRRLGRLLPDARWTWLPFMEPRQRKGDRAHILKRCCSRVKCFIETDAGFTPTPSKTDLAHHHPFTTALKHLGSMALEKYKEEVVEIYRDGKLLTPLQFEKQYQEWILQMHDIYDQEIDCGEDQPLLIVGPSNKKKLGISSDVVRVHKVLRRKGTSWKSGQMIKVLKGACAGCHKNNVYAILECFLLEGFRGDACGKPLGVPEENGCLISVNHENASIDIRGSLSLPISVIDSGKCLTIKSAEWNLQVEKHRLKGPSSIDILSAKHCQELEFEGEFPVDSIINAGHVPPEEIVAVVRPTSFYSSSASKNLDQKYIIKENFEMSLKIKFRAEERNLKDENHIYSARNLLIESRQLDNIRPSYEATLIICSQSELFSVAIPFRVIPGSLQHVTSQPTNIEKQLLPGRLLISILIAVHSTMAPGKIMNCLPNCPILISGTLDWVSTLTLEEGSTYTDMFDAYGNHVKEDAAILLNVDGFCFEDKISCVRKVDNQGCVDLSGLLKVTKGYGQSVSLSVVSDDNKVIFKEEFQTERRELRAASEIPMICEAGSQLENLVIEVINSDGDVDESIHDEEMHGQSHTLMIKSESMDTDDSIRYSFRCGRCTVRAVPLPKKEGIFSFVAAHSRHPELHLTIEVNIVQAPSMELGNMQSQSSDGSVVLLQESPAFSTPKVEKDDVVLHQFQDGKTLLLSDSSASNDVQNLVISIQNDQQELEAEVIKYGLCIGEREDKLRMLNAQKLAIEQDLYTLQASMDSINIPSNFDSLPEKEAIVEKVEGKVGSAAAVVCKLFKEIQSKEQNNYFKKSVLGVVALLGTVQNKQLSRILAEYLGEDQMLAVVCKSYVAAGALERYNLNGNVNHTRGLHALATELGISIKGRYLIICLDDISPYEGEVDSDPQMKLALPDPVLPNGKRPPGFLGYAVNMVHLGKHLHMRTTSGHGLRETLFYRLFGKLQVYESRDFMKIAYPCIKEGAVSLDGGIFIGNGVISLGNWEPDIQFPVVMPAGHLYSSQPCLAIMAQVEEKKTKLREMVLEIEKENKIHQKDLKRFNKKRDKYVKFLEEKAPLLGSLQHLASWKGSYNSPT